jgi:hypothetical protein
VPWWATRHSSRPPIEPLSIGYAFKLEDSTYGIFDTFESEDARNARLGGEIPQALAQVGPDLLAKDPEIHLVDALAVK